MGERLSAEPQIPSDTRQELLANFVLGTEVQLQIPYGEFEHDDFQDAAPGPDQYPKDAP